MKMAWSVLFVLLFNVGCGNQDTANRLPVFPVSGTVTYKGKPVVGADVTFVSETAKKGAFGRTDDKGVFRLTTYGSNDGAVEGKHSVTISKLIPVEESVVEADTESEAYVPPGLNDNDTAAQAPKNEIPVKYAKPESSGLIAVVNSDGENSVTFELED